MALARSDYQQYSRDRNDKRLASPYRNTFVIVLKRLYVVITLHANAGLLRVYTQGVACNIRAGN